MQKVERCRIKVDGRGWRRRRAKGGERYGAEAAISKGVKGRGGKNVEKGAACYRRIIMGGELEADGGGCEVHVEEGFIE